MAYDHGDSDLVEWLKELISDGSLSDAALGITKQFLDRGWSSLSERQQFVFSKHVIDSNIKQCRFCEHEIPTNEMYASSTNGGYCSSCKHNLDTYVYNDD